MKSCVCRSHVHFFFPFSFPFPLLSIIFACSSLPRSYLTPASSFLLFIFQFLSVLFYSLFLTSLIVYLIYQMSKHTETFLIFSISAVRQYFLLIISSLTILSFKLMVLTAKRLPKYKKIIRVEICNLLEFDY